MRTPRPIRFAVAALMVSICVLPKPSSLTQSIALAAKLHLWHVKVGVDFFYSGLEINKFFPDLLTIHQGDSVQWTNQSTFRAQTVTFGPILNTPPLFLKANGSEVNPAVAKPQGGHVVGNTTNTVYSSGTLLSTVPGLSASFTFTFPAAGKYIYRSLFHPLAIGEIDVVPPGAPVSSDPPDTGASYYDALKSADKIVNAEQPAERDGGANGASSVQIDVAGGDGNASQTKFTPSGITIRVGSTITWVAKETSGDPHNIYFGLVTAKPMYTRVAPDGGLLVNPAFVKVTLPSGTTVATDTVKLNTVWNSGIVYGSSVLYPSATPAKYSLTFDAVGRFTFIDPFIANSEGEIDVIP